MRLLDKFATRSLPEPGQSFGTSGVVLAQTYQMGDTERMLPVFNAYAGEGYTSNAVVFAVILARLNLFSEAEFKFRDLTTKRLFGTPDLAILENPWPNGTTGELLARMEQDASLAGNSYTLRRIDEPDRLVRLRPDWVDIVRVDPCGLVGSDSATIAGYYHYPEGRQGDHPGEFLQVEEVAHWTPIPDPFQQWMGMSWLTPVVREINADLSMTAYQREFFNNAATPNSLIRYPQELKPGALEQIATRWNARYSGANGWKTAVLDSGADMTIIGNTFDQMKFTDLQSAGENRIASAAGVPAIVAGLKEGLDAATYSNYSTAMRRFADMTMRPNWRSACAALAKLVTVPTGARLWYDTTDIAALREGEKERADTMAVLSGAASTLLMAGYEAASITSALTAGDMSLLVHTGLLSVQLQTPGSVPAKGVTP